MAKCIVILNGSPQRKGNTAALTKAFSEGAKARAIRSRSFSRAIPDDMNIHGCRGCFCANSALEMPCVQHDDMAKIYPAIKESNVVVLASPLYYWTLSG